jgi:hypothetical protein
MTASGLLIWRFNGFSGGSMQVLVGAIEQSIELVAVPRHFGGAQWYFVCPVLGRRAFVLWMPPGGNRFASRQAWGRKVAYRSQFETPPHRALSRARDLRRRLGGEDFVWVFRGFPPPRPRGMHGRTYFEHLKRLEAYEKKCDFYERRLISRNKET